MILSIMEHRLGTTLPVHRMGPEQQFHAFIEALFQPGDLVEIRAIMPDRTDSKNRGTVVLREWPEARQLVEEFPKLCELNQQGANIYFGVNPRDYRSGKKDAVTQCHVLWADLDDCTSADAEKRWRNHLPHPSIIVNSGHGVHLYWTLKEPVSVQKPELREHLEASLKALYQDLQSDSTQDVTRLLRLPGFFNAKREPVPCGIEQLNSGLIHPYSVFRHWQDLATARLSDSIQSHAVQNAPVPFDSLELSVSETADLNRIRGLVATLDRDVEDRSRRDFWVVCRLLETGLPPNEILMLVAGKSKFTTDQYGQNTMQNALDAMTQH
ncbi:DNA-primase RepB domain-containing protein [Crateriforma conspicua]|uniref:DNA-primase RepB domain-containing protein n=1 Tax=Crateriforma conspicua TaxID=2527996 RepID=UPI001187D7A8|nr:DNA-primase RepB domain-containing protein [Crateriforma conspicua]QDV62008.1 hypothetical protein Mal65_11360 [Crateriforma conspicua]